MFSDLLVNTKFTLIILTLCENGRVVEELVQIFSYLEECIPKTNHVKNNEDGIKSSTYSRCAIGKGLK